MRRIHLLVEGQTEEAIANNILIPYLESPSTWLSVSVLASSRQPGGAKVRGGVATWARIRRDVVGLLRDTSIDLLTTMIDYYGVPVDTPGMETRPNGDPLRRVRHVEQAMAGAVPAGGRFVPHLTLHETEAWIFAGGRALGEHRADAGLGDRIVKMAADAGGPELLNDGLPTAPSKRLVRLCPDYNKILDGVAVLQRAGLDTIFAQCPHAAEWIASLRA